MYDIKLAETHKRKMVTESMHNSGGSRIFKREGGGGGHKIMDTCCLSEHKLIVPKTIKWEVVKIVPMGTHPSLAQKGGHVPEMPPPPSPLDIRTTD